MEQKKQDGRGKHGKQGRKPTGRKRNKLFGGKFSDSELKEIKEAAKAEGLTQSDLIMFLIRNL